MSGCVSDRFLVIEMLGRTLVNTKLHLDTSSALLIRTLSKAMGGTLEFGHASS